MNNDEWGNIELQGCATMDVNTEYQLRKAVIKALPK